MASLCRPAGCERRLLRALGRGARWVLHFGGYLRSTFELWGLCVGAKGLTKPSTGEVGFYP